MIITLFKVNELRREVFLYLAPINLISLRNSSCQLRLLVTEDDIDQIFRISLTEGLII